MVKLTKRKGFNFFRSYYDVFNELDDKNKLAFIKALLDKQFLGVEPELKGMAKFGYISQMHSINTQVKGYEDKTGAILTPCEAPYQGGNDTPCLQEKEKVEEKGKEKEQQKGVVIPFNSENFKKSWQLWKDYKKDEHRFNYKTPQSEQAALKKLNTLADGIEDIAIMIIHESMANGWKGFFKIEKNENGINNSTKESTRDTVERFTKKFAARN